MRTAPMHTQTHRLHPVAGMQISKKCFKDFFLLHRTLLLRFSPFPPSLLDLVVIFRGKLLDLCTNSAKGCKLQTRNATVGEFRYRSSGGTVVDLCLHYCGFCVNLSIA